MSVIIEKYPAILEKNIVDFIINNNDKLTLDEIAEELKCGIPELKKIMKKNSIQKIRKKQIKYNKKGIEGTPWEKREEYRQKRTEVIEKIRTIPKQGDVFEIELQECCEMRIINALEREGKLIVITIVGNKRILKLKGEGLLWK